MLSNSNRIKLDTRQGQGLVQSTRTLSSGVVSVFGKLTKHEFMQLIARYNCAHNSLTAVL